MTDPVRPPLGQIRREAGLSQKALADAVGVTQSTVSFYESGDYMPNLALAIRIAAFFGRPVEALWANLVPTTPPQLQTPGAATTDRERPSVATELCGNYGNAREQAEAESA